MANRLYSSRTIQRIDVSFVTTPITAGSFITAGQLPANIIMTDGWAVIKTELGDVDNGDDTTLSIGYTGVAAGLYPVLAITTMDAGTYLRLIPGVLEIGAAAVITAVDTAIEIVPQTRNSGATHNGVVLTATKDVILTAGAGVNINQGTMSIFIEYLKF